MYAWRSSKTRCVIQAVESHVLADLSPASSVTSIGSHSGPDASRSPEAEASSILAAHKPAHKPAQTPALTCRAALLRGQSIFYTSLRTCHSVQVVASHALLDLTPASSTNTNVSDGTHSSFATPTTPAAKTKTPVGSAVGAKKLLKESSRLQPLELFSTNANQNDQVNALDFAAGTVHITNNRVDFFSLNSCVCKLWQFIERPLCTLSCIIFDLIVPDLGCMLNHVQDWFSGWHNCQCKLRRFWEARLTFPVKL